MKETNKMTNPLDYEFGDLFQCRIGQNPVDCKYEGFVNSDVKNFFIFTRLDNNELVTIHILDILKKL